jgi:Polyketide cyclase / dehydrase and lipid transport
LYLFPTRADPDPDPDPTWTRPDPTKGGKMQGDVVTVERVLPAAPEAIFELLADATKHPLIDGSGTVKRAKPGAPQRLSLGATFGMSMKLGVSYSMLNTVIEFDDNRRIAWQARPPGVLGRLLAGRIWRYELEPAEGGTKVRESWDLSQDRQRLFLKLGPLPERTRLNMERTLEHIEQTLSGAPDNG